MDIVNRGATSVIAPKLLSIYRGAISKTVTNYGFNLLFWTGRRRVKRSKNRQIKDHIWPKRMNRHFSELDRVPNCPSNIPVTVEINDPSRSPSCGLRRWNSISWDRGHHHLQYVSRSNLNKTTWWSSRIKYPQMRLQFLQNQSQWDVQVYINFHCLI